MACTGRPLTTPGMSLGVSRVAWSPFDRRSADCRIDADRKR